MMSCSSACVRAAESCTGATSTTLSRSSGALRTVGVEECEALALSVAPAGRGDTEGVGVLVGLARLLGVSLG